MFLLNIMILLFAIVVHEFAHGWAADKFGDPTARYAGRLTLNPLSHIDLFGTIIIPLILIISRFPVLFGYAKPVPINPYNFRNPKRDMMWVGLAGPASNVVLAVCCGLALRSLARLSSPGFESVLIDALMMGFLINMVLALFNMIPIPPLDGSRVLAGMLPPRHEYKLESLERYGFLILLGLLFIGPMLGINIFGWIFKASLALLRLFVHL